VPDNHNLLCELTFAQLFHALVSKRWKHEIVELCDNSQSDEVVNDLDGVERCQDDLNVDDFNANCDESLQEPNEPGLFVWLKQVGLIKTELHVFQSWANLIDETQVQYRAADKSDKHDYDRDVLSKVDAHVVVRDQVVEDQVDQDDLAHEADPYVQLNVRSLGFPNHKVFELFLQLLCLINLILKWILVHLILTVWILFRIDPNFNDGLTRLLRCFCVVNENVSLLIELPWRNIEVLWNYVVSNLTDEADRVDVVVQL